MSSLDERIEREIALSIEQAKLVNDTLRKVYEALRRDDPTKGIGEPRQNEDEVT